MIFSSRFLCRLPVCRRRHTNTSDGTPISPCNGSAFCMNKEQKIFSRWHPTWHKWEAGATLSKAVEAAPVLMMLILATQGSPSSSNQIKRRLAIILKSNQVHFLMTCDIINIIFIACDTRFVIMIFVIFNVKRFSISGSPSIRSCSIPGACTGKYLSCRKLKILVTRKY